MTSASRRQHCNTHKHDSLFANESSATSAGPPTPRRRRKNVSIDLASATAWAIRHATLRSHRPLPQ